VLLFLILLPDDKTAGVFAAVAMGLSGIIRVAPTLGISAYGQLISRS